MTKGVDKENWKGFVILNYLERFRDRTKNLAKFSAAFVEQLGKNKFITAEMEKFTRYL